MEQVHSNKTLLSMFFRNWMNVERRIDITRSASLTLKENWNSYEHEIQSNPRNKKHEEEQRFSISFCLLWALDQNYYTFNKNCGGQQLIV